MGTRGPRWLVGAFTAAMAAVLASAALGKWYRFGYQAFDFGIFDQGLWLLSRGETPFVTLRGLHLFGDHSSYVMLLLVPLYWVWPDPRALLLVGVVAVVAVVPLVHMAARRLGTDPWSAAFVAVAAGLHPAVAWQVSDLFHPEVLAIPLTVVALLLAQGRRWWWAVAVMAVVAAVKEDAVVLVIPFAMFMWWRWRESWKAAATLWVGSLVLLLVNLLAAIPHWLGGADYLYGSRLEPTGLLEPQRWMYPLALLGVMAFLGRRGWPGWFLAAPIVVINMVSASYHQWDIRWHYTAYAIAGLVAGAAVARPRRSMAASFLVTAAALQVAAGPWSPWREYDPWQGAGQISPVVARAILDDLPSDAVIAADHLVAAEVAHRDSVYVLPNPIGRDRFWGAPTHADPSVAVELVVLSDAAAFMHEATFDYLRCAGWPQIEQGGGVTVYWNPDGLSSPGCTIEVGEANQIQN